MNFRSVPVDWLRHRFSYDPETGSITHAWLPPKTKAGICIGDRADRPGFNNYRRVNFAYRGARCQPTAQQLAWTLHHGEHPPEGIEVDHRDRVRDHNWIDNLRLVTSLQNKSNTEGVRASKVTGLPRGVYHANAKSGFVARIGIGGKTKHIGTFRTVNEASVAYENARVRWEN